MCCYFILFSFASDLVREPSEAFPASSSLRCPYLSRVARESSEVPQQGTQGTPYTLRSLGLPWRDVKAGMCWLQALSDPGGYSSRPSEMAS